MMLKSLAALAIVSVGFVQGAAPVPQPQPLYELKPAEGVFAYSRISPDGHALAYASEARDAGGGLQRTVTVVDLRTRTVLFTEPGIDAYWSPDGRRMIYLAQDGRQSVSIRDHQTGVVTRDVAPAAA